MSGKKLNMAKSCVHFKTETDIPLGVVRQSYCQSTGGGIPQDLRGRTPGQPQEVGVKLEQENTAATRQRVILFQRHGLRRWRIDIALATFVAGHLALVQSEGLAL